MDVKRLIYYILHTVTGCKELDKHKGRHICKQCGRVYFIFK